MSDSNSDSFDSDDETLAVVIDNGSGMCKAGFEADEAPKCSFPALVGYPNYRAHIQTGEQEDCYVGDKAMEKRGVLRLKYPIQHGTITNWDDMEKVWVHCYDEQLAVKAEDQGVLVTGGPPQSEGADKERQCQIFFENFNVPAFYQAHLAPLTLYSSGRMTGCTIDSGHGMTHSMPV